MTESRIRLRMKVLAALVVFMFGALSTRLWFLQVLASRQFAELANQNQLRLVPIEPLRGEILDRNGEVLVGNRASTVVLVDRREIRGREDEVLFRLSNLLQAPVEDMLERLQSKRYLPYQPVPVAEDVSERAVYYIREHPELFPGVSYQVDSVRHYPFGSLAAHVLGHVGEISPEQLDEPAFRGYRPGDIVGKAGVEAVYERWLFGRRGTRGIRVNAQGRVLDDDFGGRPAVPGYNLVLSIDRRIQALTEDTLLRAVRMARTILHDESGRPLRATGGAAVVMDPKTGQVLAMASYPWFDPTVFLGGLSRREFARLSGDRAGTPLLNRAIQGQYPAGSTFKPFVAAAAMREGIAHPSGLYDCPAQYVAPIDYRNKHPFHNWSPRDYGPISLARALVISCDTVFYQFGYEFWVRYRRSGDRDEAMQRLLRRMGFGRRTGVDLPGEEPGLVPTEAYTRKVYREHPDVYGPYYGWLPGDSINLSIGQGFLLVTPLQMAVAFSALANGGRLLEPHVAWKIVDREGRVVKRIEPRVRGRLPISREEVAFLRDALRGVVSGEGTAASAFAGFPLDEVPVAGKTGTADVIPYQPYSWFAAMAPADDPKYVVVVMVEQGGHGATTAAPAVRRILEGLFGLPLSELQAGAEVD
ncbi:MAG TPA: penicillin-binding protein 2 [Actinomycetota bacterium]|nr:penicillin-binding protein 2 [Actinomycetota bacterium]